MERLTLRQRFTIPDYVDVRDMETGVLEFSDELCKRCGVCVRICPARSIVMEKGRGKNRPLPRLLEMAPGVTACVACGCCAAACPEGAISVVRGFRAKQFYDKLHQAPELAPPKRY